MEEAPIFVRIIIDIPIKESYNHINRRAGPYEGSADREKERT